MPRRLALLVILTYLSGCALLTPSDDAELAELMPMASPIGPTRRIMQQLTAVWTDRQETLLCVLELDKQHIAIAGLTKDGISLFNVNYDGKKVALDKSPLMPVGFSPELIIKDLQLVYWPQAELQKIMPKQWHLETDNHHRHLSFNHEQYIDVDYLQPDAVWAKSVVLTNHRYHYQLHIKTISYEAVSE
jgi:Protein of unknown function (DUF3261)